MIEITDFRITEVVETYGFFSLGYIETEHDSILTSGLKCKCSLCGKKFDVFLYRVGVSNTYIVLSDFSSIPDIAIVDSNELMSELKKHLNVYLEKNMIGVYTHKVPPYEDVATIVNHTFYKPGNVSYTTNQLSSLANKYN